MKKLILAACAIVAFSCNKPEGCGTVDGWDVDVDQYGTYYYLWVDFDNGDRDKVQVSESDYYKYNVGDNICF